LPALSGDAAISIMHVAEPSEVINIILHLIYQIPCEQYSPTFDSIVTVVNALPRYGLRPGDHIVPLKPLHTLLLSQAPLYPVDIYALASRFDLFDLAQLTSPYVLPYLPWTFSDEIVTRIGPIYLKRLFALYLERSDALKSILLHPLHPHPPTGECDFVEQKTLARSWALSTAYLAWDAQPGMSIFCYP
jgi:hypothetical protein